MTSPHVRARKFVRTVLRAVFRDAFDLAYPTNEGPNETARAAAYGRLERAVREEHGYPVRDLDHLYDLVVEAFPQEHFAALDTAFTAYHVARIEQLVTTQQASYLMGIAVGQALSRRGARALASEGGAS